MKAIILASGCGKRLLPLTEKIPKSLIKINSRTILDIELSNLADCGINDIIITTGYQAVEIKNHIDRKSPDIKFTLVNNEKYDTTNYIYSLWLAGKYIDDNVILLHGDMLFEQKLLSRLIMSSFDSAVLINPKISAPAKDFKAEVKNNFIKTIAVELNSEKYYYCAPVYKLSKQSFDKWLAKIESYINQGRVECYAEDAFNEISDDIGLRPVYYEDEFCMEIDTYKDLKAAERYYSNLPS